MTVYYPQRFRRHRFGVWLLALAMILTLAFRHQSHVTRLEQQEDGSQITVWWPDALNPLESRVLLDEQFEAFRDFSGIDLEVRRRTYAQGEFVRQLSLTQRVAPDALPDLVLMHHRDLPDAVRQNVVLPLNGWLPATLVDMPDNQRALGTIEDQLVGLPYLLTVQHMVYAPGLVSQVPASLGEVIERQTPLLFPAMPTENESINDVLLTQYVAAGGSFATATDAPGLDEALVLDLLTFYAQATQDQIIAPCLIDNETCLLNYDTPRDYTPNLDSETPGLSWLDSSLFLQRRDTRYIDLQVASLPTLDGEPATLLSGWVWVLVTPNANRQQAAQRFIQWMTSTDNMATLADALDMLPAQASALRIMSDDPRIEQLGQLLDAAYFIADEDRRGAAAVALQNAFEQVLRGTTPDEAVASAVESLQQ